MDDILAQYSHISLKEARGILEQNGINTSTPGLKNKDRHHELLARLAEFESSNLPSDYSQESENEIIEVPQLSMKLLKERLVSVGADISTPGISGEERRSILTDRLMMSLQSSPHLLEDLMMDNDTEGGDYGEGEGNWKRSEAGEEESLMLENERLMGSLLDTGMMGGDEQSEEESEEIEDEEEDEEFIQEEEERSLEMVWGEKKACQEELIQVRRRRAGIVQSRIHGPHNVFGEGHPIPSWLRGVEQDPSLVDLHEQYRLISGELTKLEMEESHINTTSLYLHPHLKHLLLDSYGEEEVEEALERGREGVEGVLRKLKGEMEVVTEEEKRRVKEEEERGGEYPVDMEEELRSIIESLEKEQEVLEKALAQNSSWGKGEEGEGGGKGDHHQNPISANQPILFNQRGPLPPSLPPPSHIPKITDFILEKQQEMDEIEETVSQYLKTAKSLEKRCDGEYDTVIEAFEDGIRIGIDAISEFGSPPLLLPSLPLLFSSFALFLHKQVGDHEKAEEMYKKGVEFMGWMERERDKSRLCGNYALFLKKVRGESEVAEEMYRRAVREDPSNPTSLCNLAHFLNSTMGEEEEAMELFQASLRIDPKNIYCLCMYSKALRRQGGRMGEAEIILKAALGVDQDHPMVLCNYGSFLAKVRKDLHSARILLKRGVTLYPKKKMLRRNYMIVLRDQNKMEQEEERMREEEAIEEKKKKIKLEIVKERKEHLIKTSQFHASSNFTPSPSMEDFLEI